jgi:toxin ParE1/3/4
VKPVRTRAAADRDVDEALDYYMAEAGERVAASFARAVETAYRVIGDRPRTGSPRHGEQMHFEGLRTRRLGRFPYLVFYVERPRHIEVWRVLHAQRDIPTELVEG